MRECGRVVVGISGGVDSAVAALLLKRQGWQVTGLFMKNWEDDDDDEYCASREDLVAAAAACDVLGIELDTVNFSAAYRERVFAEFLREYQAGRTPNPDVLCNSEIKFAAFLDHAMKLGADRIATGHYAQVREFDGVWQLLKGEDGVKDQSYFLYRLNQAQLAKSLFPIGHLMKREVRALAREAGLPNAERRDSTGICFIGERRFRDFLGRYLPDRPGEIRELDTDRVLGEHEGLMYHTLGQRKGAHVGGVRVVGEVGLAFDVEHAAVMRKESPYHNFLDLSQPFGSIPGDDIGVFVGRFNYASGNVPIHVYSPIRDCNLYSAPDQIR